MRQMAGGGVGGVRGCVLGCVRVGAQDAGGGCGVEVGRADGSRGVEGGRRGVGDAGAVVVGAGDGVEGECVVGLWDLR